MKDTHVKFFNVIERSHSKQFLNDEFVSEGGKILFLDEGLSRYLNISYV